MFETSNIKMYTLKDLDAEVFEAKKLKYPSFPVNYLTQDKHSDKTANKLTGAIIAYLKVKGYQAERISSQGRYIDKKRVVTDCIGRTRTIGSGKWVPTSGQRGTADISATIKGRSVKIEVKIGNDRQSEFQKEYQRQVETAGGVYIIAKTFEGFVKDIETL